MRTILLALLYLVVHTPLYPQGKVTPDEEKYDTINATGYVLTVPMAWRQLTGGDGYISTRVFDAGGVSFPVQHNGKDVVAIMFLMEKECGSIEEARQLCLRSCSDSQGKTDLTADDYQLKHFRLASGQQAYKIHTRFYRPSNGLYQSRYDLVAYSAKTGKAYFYTVTLQYNDNTTAFETQYNLDGYATYLFSKLLLK